MRVLSLWRTFLGKKQPPKEQTLMQPWENGKQMEETLCVGSMMT